MNDGLLIPQNRLGKKGLLALIFLLNMTGPMSTDLYLSAFPTIIQDFRTTSSMLNYTLVGFFISFAVGMLFIGPISDKFGRKPILLLGIFVYGVSSVFCGLATNIESLIISRVVQALGAGAMVSVSTAMVKESFTNDERPRIIALLQMLGAFAPTVAPLLGAQIIQFISWHATFYFLGILACISFAVACLVSETLPREQRLKGDIFESIWSLKDIVSKKPFMIFLLSMSGSSIMYMAFLAVSSYIYIEWFTLSKTQYSLFFAVNSLVLLLGPRAYLYAYGRYSSSQIIKFGFTTIVISGILVASVGMTSPYVFLVCFFPITFVNSFMRAFASNILLGQKDMNAGGAASVINFSNTALGSLGMVLGALSWSNIVQGLGFVILIAVTFSIIIWLIFVKKQYKLSGLNDN